MTLRHTRWAAFLVAAGLAVAAAPAAATEGPPGAVPQLPEPLPPVTIQPAPPPAIVRALRPRVLRARVVPRRSVAGHRSGLRTTLATTRPGRDRDPSRPARASRPRLPAHDRGAHTDAGRAAPRVPTRRALPRDRGLAGRAGQPLTRRPPLAARGAPLSQSGRRRRARTAITRSRRSGSPPNAQDPKSAVNVAPTEPNGVPGAMPTPTAWKRRSSTLRRCGGLSIQAVTTASGRARLPDPQARSSPSAQERRWRIQPVRLTRSPRPAPPGATCPK